MIRNYSATELRNVVLKVDEVLGLLMRDDIVEVNVLIAPFKVVDNALVCQFLLNDEQVLEEVDDPLVYVKVIKLGNHCFLVF